MANNKSCSEQIEELIYEAKKGNLTIDGYLIEFSRLVGRFLDNLKESKEKCYKDSLNKANKALLIPDTFEELSSNELKRSK